MESVALTVLNYIHSSIEVKSSDEQDFWNKVNEWKVMMKQKGDVTYINENIFSNAYEHALRYKLCISKEDFCKKTMYRFVLVEHFRQGGLSNFLNIFSKIIVGSIDNYYEDVVRHGAPHGYGCNTMNDKEVMRKAVETYIDCYERSAKLVNCKLTNPNTGTVPLVEYKKLKEEYKRLLEENKRLKGKKRKISRVEDSSESSSIFE